MKNFAKTKIAALLVAALTALTGCGSMQGNGTLIGAGGGAGIGALIGSLVSGHGDKTKGALIGAAIGGAVGGTTGNLIGKHMDKVKAETAAKLQQANVETITDANGLTGVKVTFDSGILFATNKSDLNANSKSELSKFAGILQNNTDCSVVVRGHTDASGTDAINNPLSVKRAESVAKYLNSCGVSSNQFKAVEGFGSTMPVADNATAEGKAKNRRVEVYLFASEAMIKAAQNGTLN